MRQFFCLPFLAGSDYAVMLLKENRFPQQKEVLIDKLFFNIEMFADIYLTRPARRNKAREQAAKILDLIGGWLGEDDVFVLGNPDYTLGDIMATAFLTRLNIQTAWFDE